MFSYNFHPGIVAEKETTNWEKVEGTKIPTADFFLKVSSKEFNPY
jgi:hypothetical protein